MDNVVLYNLNKAVEYLRKADTANHCLTKENGSYERVVVDQNTQKKIDKALKDLGAFEISVMWRYHQADIQQQVRENIQAYSEKMNMV